MSQSQTTTDISDSESKSVETRGEDGRFLPGVSGNPAGRPKGRKNLLTVLKQDLEIAIRKNLCQQDIQNVVNAMLQQALDGNVGAGKLILDKVLSNAKEGEDEKESGGALKVIIEHANFEAMQHSTNVIESKAEELQDEQREQSGP